jgi:hypothetical protein
LVFAGLLAASVVVMVGQGTAIEWTGTYLPVAVLLGVGVGTLVLFVREGAKVYKDLYKRL